MEQTERITARGTGVWGGRRYDVELTETKTTWTDSLRRRSVDATSYGMRCAPTVGKRYFGADAGAREAFLTQSFSELDLHDLSPPDERIPTQSFDEILTRELSAVTFVRDYAQLSFDSPPLTLWVWPRICRDSSVLHRDRNGYVDALLALIGRRLVSTDELLDIGLVLDFDDHTRLAIPLDGTDAHGPEIAMFDGEPGGLWIPGEPPFQSPSHQPG